MWWLHWSRSFSERGSTEVPAEPPWRWSFKYTLSLSYLRWTWHTIYSVSDEITSKPWSESGCRFQVWVQVSDPVNDCANETGTIVQMKLAVRYGSMASSSLDNLARHPWSSHHLWSLKDRQDHKGKCRLILFQPLLFNFLPAWQWSSPNLFLLWSGSTPNLWPKVLLQSSCRVSLS